MGFLRPRNVVPAEAGMTPAAHGDDARARIDPPAPGVLDELTGALSSARLALAGFLELLSLEARRAGLALVWMAVSGVIAAICIVTAWLGLMTAVALWAISLGLHPIAVVITLAAINLTAAAILIRVCIGMSENLRFSVTRRQVAGTSVDRPLAP